MKYNFNISTQLTCFFNILNFWGFFGFFYKSCIYLFYFFFFFFQMMFFYIICKDSHRARGFTEEGWILGNRIWLETLEQLLPPIQWASSFSYVGSWSRSLIAHGSFVLPAVLFCIFLWAATLKHTHMQSRDDARKTIAHKNGSSPGDFWRLPMDAHLLQE